METPPNLPTATSTPITDKWTGLRHDIRALAETSRALERDRAALREALEAIEERYADGEDTYDDWQFMGQAAHAALAESDQRFNQEKE